MNRASIIIILILIVILSLRECSHSNEINEVRSQYNDTLTTYIDKNGVKTAKIQVIKEVDTKTFLELKSSKESIKALQKEVLLYKKKLKDATFARVETSVNSTGKTTIIKVDTIIVNEDKKIYPIYKSNKSNEWVKWDVIASKDSINVDLKVINKFTISQIDKREGVFKPKKTFVEFKNLNPYTETQELQKFEVDNKKKKPKISIGPYIGVNILGSPTIGIGAMYTLIRI